MTGFADEQRGLVTGFADEQRGVGGDCACMTIRELKSGNLEAKALNLKSGNLEARALKFPEIRELGNPGLSSSLKSGNLEAQGSQVP